jgi:hypothetical protein
MLSQLLNYRGHYKTSESVWTRWAVMFLVLLTASWGFAQSSHSRLSGELRGRHGANDVDVIVQYKVPPQQKHFDKVTGKGGAMKADLKGVIRGAAISVPESALEDLAADPDFVPNPTFWPGTAVLSSTALISDGELPVTGIAFNGAPTLYADYCSGYGTNVSGGYTVCIGSKMATNNAVPNQTPTMLTDGTNTGGGGVMGAKGRLIFETNGTGNSNAHQIITLYDSNPGKTQATTGHRPVGDPGDMYLGKDPNGYLMIGGGAKGIAQYVNNIGDGVNLGELLTGSLKTFKVPVQAPVINVTTGFQVNGSYGKAGECIISTGSGSKWGTPATPSSALAANDIGSSISIDTPQNDVASTEKTYQGVSDAPSSPFAPAPANTTLHADLDGKAQVCENGVCTRGPTVGSGDWTGLRRTSGSVSFISAIANGTCTDGTFPWNGVRTSETLIAGWPTNLNSGLIGSLYVSSADTVTVRLCNFSGGAVTPGGIDRNSKFSAI